MSKILFNVYKDKEFSEKYLNNIQKVLAANLLPHPKANIQLLKNDNKSAYFIINPTKSVLIKNNSVALGLIAESNQLNWGNINQPAPTGSYAIFRQANQQVELLSDEVASRSIWYYFDNQQFIASTSQRAIIMLLQSLELNYTSIAWMMASGSIGPYCSWDTRIKLLMPKTSLLLNQQTWNLTITTQPDTPFGTPNNQPIKKQQFNQQLAKQQLNTILQNNFDNINVSNLSYSIPLSGGYDSRAVAYFMAKKQPINTFTYGLKNYENNLKNDIAIAQKVAEQLNATHTFYNNSLANLPIEKILERYLLASEGRIDHIDAFMDGLQLYADLQNKNIDLIFRGDEAFGWLPAYNPLDVRLCIGMPFITDFSNLPTSFKAFQELQTIPPYFNQNPNETIPAWRDRLYHSFRLPCILAALTDIAACYTEVANPLLFKPVINFAKQIPDNFRTQKKLFSLLVKQQLPTIPISKSWANNTAYNLLRSPKIYQHIIENISTNSSKQLIGNNIVNFIQTKSSCNTGEQNQLQTRSNTLQNLIKYIPMRYKSIIKQYYKPPIDVNQLALRAYIITKMQTILTNDALAIKNTNNS